MARGVVRAPAETRREEILAAARGCFAARGYHQTTVDEIAARAGLSKGAVYWHFEGKREIFLAVLDRYVEETLQGFEQVVGGAGSAREALERLSDAALAKVPQSGLVGASLEYMAHALRDEAFRERLQRLFRDCRRLIAAQLRRGIESGEFRRFDVEAVAAALFAALDGLLLQSLLVPDVRPERVWPGALEVVLAGLRA